MRTRWILGSAVTVLVLTLAGGFLRSATREEPGLKDLAKSRITIARRALDQIEQFLKAPPDARAGDPAFSMELLEQRIAWSRRWMDSQLDLSDSRQACADAIRDHINRLEKWLAPMRELARGGAASGVSQSHVDLLEYAILEAKAALLKESAVAK